MCCARAVARGGIANDQRLELADERIVRSESQVGVHPILEAGEPELFQTRALNHGERLLETGERRSAPQRKGFAQLGRGALGVTAGELGPAVLAEAAEPHDVDGGRVELDRIAGRARQQDLRRKQLAQLRAVDLHHLHGWIRNVIAPEVLHETLDGDGAVDVEQEPGEQRALLRPPRETTAAPS